MVRSIGLINTKEENKWKKEINKSTLQFTENKTNIAITL